MCPKKLLMLLATLPVAWASHAASVPLTITGSVLPEACNITLGGGGTVDFGAMAHSTVIAYPLINNIAYVVTKKTVLLTVNCSSAVPIALAFNDNKAASKAPIDSSDAFYFGIGMAGANKVGAYSLNIQALEISPDSTPAVKPRSYLTRPLGSTGAWTEASGTSEILASPADELGFGLLGIETTPAALRVITGNLAVEPYLLKSTIDGATTEIFLDGSATISIVYL